MNTDARTDDRTDGAEGADGDRGALPAPLGPRGLGIGVAAPRLSWITETEASAWPDPTAGQGRPAPQGGLALAAHQDDT